MFHVRTAWPPGVRAFTSSTFGVSGAQELLNRSGKICSSYSGRRLTQIAISPPNIVSPVAYAPAAARGHTLSFFGYSHPQSLYDVLL